MSNCLKHPWLENGLLNLIKNADVLPIRVFKCQPLQIFEYIRYEHPIRCKLSDTEFYIEAEFSSQSISDLNNFTEKRITSLRGGIVTLGNFLIHLIPSQSGVIPWIQVESFNFQGCEGAVFGNPKAITTSALFNALLQSPYLAALANEFKRSIKEGSSYQEASLSQQEKPNDNTSNSRDITNNIQFHWKNMTSLSIEECIIPKEQQLILEKESEDNTTHGIYLEERNPAQGLHNSVETPEVKQEDNDENLDAYSWSSSTDSAEEIPSLPTNRKILEKIAEKPPPFESPLEDDETPDQTNEHEANQVNVSQLPLNPRGSGISGRPVESTEQLNSSLTIERSQSIQSTDSKQRVETQSHRRSKIEIFDAQDELFDRSICTTIDDSTGKLLNAEETPIKTGDLHSTSASSVISCTPPAINFAGDICNEQIELEYKRKPIPDYDFMKGLETTLQELYVEHQSKKRRLELFQLTNNHQKNSEACEMCRLGLPHGSFFELLRDWKKIEEFRNKS